MMMRVTAHCNASPANGELKGRFEAKNLEKGKIPSRPSSWLTRPWENCAKSAADRLGWEG